MSTQNTMPLSQQDLVVQGETLTFDIAKTLANHSHASNIIPVAKNVFRLQCAQKNDDVVSVCAAHAIDYAYVPSHWHLSDFKLFVFDMDSTLINIECIDEMADRCDVKPQVAAITERAMRGEIDFETSLRERVGLLHGLTLDDLEYVYQHRLMYNPGVKTLLSTLHQHHISTLLVSGGFTFFAERVQNELKMTYAYANRLHIQGEHVTGALLGDIVDGQAKARYLQQTCQQLNITTAQTIAIGDGSNDIPMMQAAAFGIAYHAKPIVRQHARFSLNHVGLDGILHWFSQGLV